jgi:aminomethyltransferase
LRSRVRRASTLQKLTDADLSAVKFYWVTRGTVCGLKNILMGRTGYTAEDGFEIYIPPDEKTSARVWYEILEAGKEFGASPAASGARNTLRLEGCCLSTATKSRTRSMCGKPAWIVSAKWRSRNSSAEPRSRRRKPEGVKKTLVGLEMVDRGIARDGYKILDDAGSEIGYVTSGSPAPFLKKNIALAYVPPDQIRDWNRAESRNPRTGSKSKK